MGRFIIKLLFPLWVTWAIPVHVRHITSWIYSDAGCARRPSITGEVDVVRPRATLGRVCTCNEYTHTKKGWAWEATHAAPCSSYLRRRLASAGASGDEPKITTRSLYDESGNSTRLLMTGPGYRVTMVTTGIHPCLWSVPGVAGPGHNAGECCPDSCRNTNVSRPV